MKPSEKDSETGDSQPEYAPDDDNLGMEVGAVGCGIAGAALGAVLGGPAGAVAGAAFGASVGAAAGFGMAKGIDPIAEPESSQKRDHDEPDFESDAVGDYSSAYKLGWQLYSPQVDFESAEENMSSLRALQSEHPELEWDKAREAAKAGWLKAHQTLRQPNSP